MLAQCFHNSPKSIIYALPSHFFHIASHFPLPGIGGRNRSVSVTSACLSRLSSHAHAAVVITTYTGPKLLINFCSTRSCCRHGECPTASCHFCRRASRGSDERAVHARRVRRRRDDTVVGHRHSTEPGERDPGPRPQRLSWPVPLACSTDNNT